MLCVGWEGGTLLEWLLPLGGMSFGFDALACVVQTIQQVFMVLLFTSFGSTFSPGVYTELELF